MPRKSRVKKEGFYHNINHSVPRDNIFLEDKDYEKILEIMGISKTRYDFTLHVLCLMSNHNHLLVESKHRNLSLLV